MRISDWSSDVCSSDLAWIFPEKTAVIDDDGSFGYRQLYERCRRMAGSLRQLGVGAGDTVAVLCFNGNDLLESHYSVPMIGAVLHAFNTRLAAASPRFLLRHREGRVPSSAPSIKTQADGVLVRRPRQPP